jgi:hypothetical protein
VDSVDDMVKPETWPEQSTPHNVNPGLGLAFSGGGFRALCITARALQQFQANKLMKSVDYISAVSGGSWASTIYTYYQSGNGRPNNDEDLLGPYVPPEGLTNDFLGNLSSMRLAFAATARLELVLAVLIIEAQLKLRPWETIWQSTIAKAILEPYIGDTVQRRGFTYNVKTKAILTKNNPSLVDMFLPAPVSGGRKSRPFLVLLSPYIGPTNLAPIDVNKSTIPLPCEWTPLYYGYPKLRTNVKYFSAKGETASINL